MTTAPHSPAAERTTNIKRSDERATPAFRSVLLLAAVLAVGVIGWEHAYHSLVLDVVEEHGADGHLGHMLRDAVLAFPMALLAVAAGLRFGRRFGVAARAGFVSAAFGLLLVPSVRLHAVVDDALAGGTANAHEHEHAAQGGVEASTGFAAMLLHGVRDA